jgi:hypothetical protein
MIMDTHDLPQMLDGLGAVWTNLDYPDDQMRDDLHDLDAEDRDDLCPSPARHGRREGGWQTTKAESDHLDQPDFHGPWDRLRWFMAASLRQQRELALIANDTADLTRIEMECAALEFVSEADAVIAALRDRDHINEQDAPIEIDARSVQGDSWSRFSI